MPDIEEAQQRLWAAIEAQPGYFYSASGRAAIREAQAALVDAAHAAGRAEQAERVAELEAGWLQSAEWAHQLQEHDYYGTRLRDCGDGHLCDAAARALLSTDGTEAGT